MLAIVNESLDDVKYLAPQAPVRRLEWHPFPVLL